VQLKFELIEDRYSTDLVVIQKRSSLLIGWYHALLSSEVDFLAEDTWDRDDQGSDEEDAHDDECEDPLECNGSSEELTDSKSCGKDAEWKAHGVVLEYDQEEQAIDQDTPDRYIGQDTSCQIIGVDSNRSIPVESDKCPGERSGNDWSVDESWVRIVAKVEERQVEEIDYQNDLRPDEVSTDEEHNKGKV